MSDSTIRVRVDRPQFRYNYEQYEEGDELDVPEAVLERHRRDLEVIEADEDEAEADAESASDDADAADDEDEAAFEYDPDDVDPHPSDLTVPEIRDRVGDLDDVAQLRAIRHLEGESENRTTAIEAIDGRINALEADTGEE